MATETLGSRLGKIMHEVAHGSGSVAENYKERAKRRKTLREDIQKSALSALEKWEETDMDMILKATTTCGFSLKDVSKAVEFSREGKGVKVAFARYGHWESPFETREALRFLSIIAYPEGTERGVRLYEIEKTVGQNVGSIASVVRDHNSGIITDDHLTTMRDLAIQLHQALEAGQIRVEL